MRSFHSGGYETCIHSHKKKNAPWKVYDSCPNPGRLPRIKGHELPYKSMCLNCPFYRRATNESTRSVSNGI